MSENSRIHVAMIANDLNINGISTVIMNYCKYLDRKTFEVTIIAGAPVAPYYIEEAKKKAINIIELPGRKKTPLRYYLSLWKALSRRFDIIHVHGNSATIAIELFFAKLKGIDVRIAHSHNTKCKNMKMHKFLYPLFNKVYTHGFACSSLAGKWLFKNKDFYVIPNGFRIERFYYNAEYRNEIRRKLGLEDKFIIGHIGRFNEQKNHQFLLQVFSETAAENEKAYLLLVGNGPQYDKIVKLIDEHPYKDRIILYGETETTEKIYSALDVFVLPSTHEGLGIVLLEAQISGLFCVVSNVVPPEAIIIKKLVKLLDLNDSIPEWAAAILNADLNDRKKYRNEYINEMQKYDIEENTKFLSSLYEEFSGKIQKNS